MTEYVALNSRLMTSMPESVSVLPRCMRWGLISRSGTWRALTDLSSRTLSPKVRLELEAQIVTGKAPRRPRDPSRPRQDLFAYPHFDADIKIFATIATAPFVERLYLTHTAPGIYRWVRSRWRSRARYQGAKSCSTITTLMHSYYG